MGTRRKNKLVNTHTYTRINTRLFSFPLLHHLPPPQQPSSPASSQQVHNQQHWTRVSISARTHSHTHAHTSTRVVHIYLRLFQNRNHIKWTQLRRPCLKCGDKATRRLCVVYNVCVFYRVHKYNWNITTVGCRKHTLWGTGEANI